MFRETGLDDVVTLAFPLIADVKDVPLHLFGEGFELVPETGEDLPLTGDEVSNPPIGTEIPHDDDGVVREDEFLQPLFVSSIHDIDEDGVAVATEHSLDDIGADGVVGVVEGVVAHISCVFGVTLSILRIPCQNRLVNPNPLPTLLRGTLPR